MTHIITFPLLVTHHQHNVITRHLKFCILNRTTYVILTSRANTWPELHPLPKSIKIDFAVRFADIFYGIILKHAQNTYYS